MSKLDQLKCTPLTASSTAISGGEIAQNQKEIPEWRLVEKGGEQQLERTFKFKNFSEALSFTNKIGQAAEEQDHHPSILTEWGQVTINWWTHKVKGLHLNDFIMAAKTDRIFEK